MSSTTLNKMSHMKLLGMLRSYQTMLGNRIHNDLSHDEVVDTLIQAEWEDRENKKINRHLKRARFRYGASVEEIDFTAKRGLDKTQILRLADGSFDKTAGTSHYVDYKPITGSNPFALSGNVSGVKSLYNGNISAMSVNNAGLLNLPSSGNSTMPLLYSYRYDQLNLIVSMQAYKGLDVLRGRCPHRPLLCISASFGARVLAG